MPPGISPADIPRGSYQSLPWLWQPFLRLRRVRAPLCAPFFLKLMGGSEGGGRRNNDRVSHSSFRLRLALLKPSGPKLSDQCTKGPTADR